MALCRVKSLFVLILFARAPNKPRKNDIEQNLLNENYHYYRKLLSRNTSVAKTQMINHKTKNKDLAVGEYVRIWFANRKYHRKDMIKQHPKYF